MKITGYLYILIGGINIAAELLSSGTVHYITTPLLMPVLIAFYIQSRSGVFSKIDRFLIIALIFSWIGDLSLMLVKLDKNLFLVGLGGFLVTHLFYILVFNMVRDRSVQPVLRRKIWLLIPLPLYMVGMLTLIYPGLEAAIRIPVVIYTAIIGTMVAFALNRYKRVNDSSFALVFSGALIFVVSDSLIALNNFLCRGTLFLAGFWIMSTYIVAQYLIVKGILANEIVE